MTIIHLINIWPLITKGYIPTYPTSMHTNPYLSTDKYTHDYSPFILLSQNTLLNKKPLKKGLVKYYNNQHNFTLEIYILICLSNHTNRF